MLNSRAVFGRVQLSGGQSSSPMRPTAAAAAADAALLIALAKKEARWRLQLQGNLRLSLLRLKNPGGI